MVWEVIISIVGTIAIVVIAWIFLFRLGRYSFLGNTLLFVAIFYVLSVILSIYLKFNPLKEHGQSVIIDSSKSYPIEDPGALPTNGFILVLQSFFDGLKMITMSFDKTAITDYFASKSWNHIWFGVVYLGSAVSGLFYTSALVVIAFFKGLGVKGKTFFKSLRPSKEMYYIFTDSKVSISIRLAEGLKNDGKNVVIYLSRASQKTQEGTEYKDMISGKGLDVRVEKYGPGLVKYLFWKHFSKATSLLRFLGFNKKKVFVYGLFSDDDTSVEIANNFRTAITYNKRFAKAKRILYRNENYGKPSSLDDLKKNLDDDKKCVSAINELGKLCGVKKVVNYKNRYIRKFIKRNKISDDLTGYLIKTLEQHKFKQELGEDFVIYDIQKLKNMIDELKKQKKAEVPDYMLNAIENYKVFVTYHESDIDYANNYSETTCHMLNTMSEYDMISSEFVLNNQLTNFMDVLNFNDEDNKNMHVTFFGLGKINKPILEKMTYAYQLWGDNTNKVQYHVLDSRASSLVEEFKNIYTGDLKPNKDAKYLPLLYNIQGELDGKDLCNYEVVDQYVKDTFLNENRFVDNGFEIFIVSLTKTTTDIQIALNLRKAILKYYKANEKTKSIKKAVIFVRVGNSNVSRSFFSNNTYVKDQAWVNNGNLLKDRTEDELAPIVIFGENALMSEYVSSHYLIIDKLGQMAQKSYSDDDLDKVRKSWVLKNKREVLDNTCTVYSLKTKLALLGYQLDGKYRLIKDGKIVKNYNEEIRSVIGLRDEDLGKKEENKFLPIENYSKEMQRLAELEHNRWVASCYVIWKYRQRKFDDFYAEFASTGKNNDELKYKTKNGSKTEHVCMITNEGLQILKDTMYNEAIKRVATLNPKIVEFQCANLTVLNDIKGMRDIFLGLPK